MKAKILLLLLALLQVLTVCSQPYSYKWAIGMQSHFRDFKGFPNGERDSADFNFAFGGYLGVYMNPSFRLDFRGAFVPVKGNDNSINTITEWTSSLNYTLNNGYILKRNSGFAPFLKAGLGTYMDEQVNERRYFMPLGAGIDLNFTNLFALQVQGVYNRGVSPNAVNFASIIVGLNTYLGATVLQKEPREVPPPPVAQAKVREPEAVEPSEEAEVPKKKKKLKKTKDDSDGDGILNEDDRCPDDAGLITSRGCPDKDLDDVPDAEDECPEEEGLAINNGCPKDTDNDGIRDAIDRCPEMAGIEYHKGCPDDDFDNIPNPDDECPNDYGDVSLKGCPDMDGDGIRDQDDKCPRQAGLVIRDGCPIFPEIEAPVTKQEDLERPYEGDDDAAAIPFLMDEVESVLDMASRQVRFEAGTDRLKGESYPVLDRIVSIMQDKPDYSLRVIGHTDSKGDNTQNQRLSERRARACKNYLAKKGIATRRIFTIGYGETQPIAENETAAGRIQNQRVEFKLFIR